MKKMLTLLVIGFVLFSYSCEKDITTLNDIEKSKNIITNNPFKKKKTVVYKSINGIDNNLLSLDIYYTKNTNKKKPIIIYVHGGGWVLGDKENNINNKASLFQSQNWLFISLNYRLSPIPYQLFNPNRIKYPDHNNDIADAIKWVYDHIGQYGGDPDNIVLLGHSAGAHLVSLTGTNKSFLNNRGLPLSTIKGVASIDTEGYDVLDQIKNSPTINKLYINAFGKNKFQNRDASPLYNLAYNTTYPKFFIAKRGSLERKALADQFIKALDNASISVSQIDGSIYTHSEINDAIGGENETVITLPLIKFIKSCIKYH